MGAIKNFLKIFYKKISFPAKRLFSSNFHRLITSIFILLILSANLFLLTNCEDEVIQPPPKPPGYQEDIPWPSLADSPWPMNHHDSQSSGRSKYIGPSQGIVVKKIQSGELQNSIVIGKNRTLLFSPTRDSISLYSIDYDGNVVWKISIPSDEIFTTPLIANDGTVYFYSQELNDWNVYAVDVDGKIKWNYKPEGEMQLLGMNIGLDGTIYLISGAQNLIAVGKSGQEIWKYYDTRFYSSMWSSLTMSPDGKTIYIQGFTGVTLIAFDLISKSIKWTWGSASLYNSPIVDAKGNIYIFPSNEIGNKSKFYCLSPDGNIRWEYEYTLSQKDKFLNLDPAIDKNGNIYFGYSTIYSLDYTGKLRWKYELDGHNNYSPLICDLLGNIFIGLENNSILSINNDGMKNWQVQVEGERALGLSPAISGEGLLYYPTFRSNSIIIIR